MSDNIAIMGGYTRSVMAESNDGLLTLFLLIRQDADLGARIKAWDTDDQEWIWVEAHMFDWHDLGD